MAVINNLGHHAKHIRNRNADMQPEQIGIQLENEKVQQKPRCGDASAHRNTLDPQFVDALIFLGAIALAGHTHAACIDGIGDGIDQNGNLAGGCAACHGNIAKGVDDGLRAVLHPNLLLQHGVLLEIGDKRAAGEQRVTLEQNLIGHHRDSLIFCNAIIEFADAKLEPNITILLCYASWGFCCAAMDLRSCLRQ